MHAVGVQAEEEAVFAADALAEDAVAGLELDDADEGRGFAAGEAADHGERGAGGLAGKFLEGFTELVGKLDEAEGLVAGGLLGEIVRGLVVARNARPPLRELRQREVRLGGGGGWVGSVGGWSANPAL